MVKEPTSGTTHRPVQIFKMFLRLMSSAAVGSKDVVSDKAIAASHMSYTVSTVSCSTPAMFLLFRVERDSETSTYAAGDGR